MTVAELIEQLKKHDQDADVLVRAEYTQDFVIACVTEEIHAAPCDGVYHRVHPNFGEKAVIIE